MPALVELDKAAPSLRANDVWRDEAQNGLAAAQNHLASLFLLSWRNHHVTHTLSPLVDLVFTFLARFELV